MRTRTALAAGVLLSTSASASGLDPTMAPSEAIRALHTYCLETDARTAKAETAITALKLPTEAIQLSPNPQGVSLRLDLGGGAKLDIDLETSGQVRACTLRAALSNTKATFIELQKLLQVGGNVEDYEPGNKEWIELGTPGGAKVSMLITFAIRQTLAGESRGTMTATVMSEQ